VDKRDGVSTVGDDRTYYERVLPFDGQNPMALTAFEGGRG
jgi:hypothetical protein